MPVSYRCSNDFSYCYVEYKNDSSLDSQIFGVLDLVNVKRSFREKIEPYNYTPDNSDLQGSGNIRVIGIKRKV